MLQINSIKNIINLFTYRKSDISSAILHTVHIVTRSDELSIGVVDWLDLGNESITCFIYNEEMKSSIGIMTVKYININRLECIERTNSVRIYIKNQVIPTNNMIYEILYLNLY